jgi:hypothetical protein
LSTGEGDAVKNYYTCLYHVCRDKSLLEFGGMNYPYGEHVIYTDGQPLIANILRFLPFTHGSLVGILHSLLMISLITSPLILFRLFSSERISPVLSFFLSMGIVLLAPQIFRFGGHLSLAYTFVVPLNLLLILQAFRSPGTKRSIILCIYNSFLFLLHPYLGLGASLFTFFAFLFHALFSERSKILKNILIAAITGCLPVLLFNIFMSISDSHTDRPEDPYGSDFMFANMESILTPAFGPLRHFMQQIIKVKRMEWEGQAYIGAFMFFVTPVVIVSLFVNRDIRVKSRYAAHLLCAALIMLLIAFGLHHFILRAAGIEIGFVKQFRSAGRFAWYFYYCLPVFILPELIRLMEKTKWKALTIPVAGCFFISNLIEGNAFVSGTGKSFFRQRNFFNQKLLSENEKTCLRHLDSCHAQAIVPLPLFHVGSELYEYHGEKSMAPAFMFSFHSGLPLISSMLARTSIRESIRVLEIANLYKRNRPVMDSLHDPLIVLTTKGALYPEEKRLQNLSSAVFRYDSVIFSTIKPEDLETFNNLSRFTDITNSKNEIANNNVLFIKNLNRKPFLESRISEKTVLLNLPAGQLTAGHYVLSLHYHFRLRSFRSGNILRIDEYNDRLHVVKQTEKRVLHSVGIYDGFTVAEAFLQIVRGHSYTISLSDDSDKQYHVSHLLIRPDTMNLMYVSGNDTLLNNYPRE